MPKWARVHARAHLMNPRHRVGHDEGGCAPSVNGRNPGSMCRMHAVRQLQVAIRSTRAPPCANEPLMIANRPSKTSALVCPAALLTLLAACGSSKSGFPTTTTDPGGAALPGDASVQLLG